MHWSGHGHQNLLELARPGGARDQISGAQLLELFIDAGGFLPRLFFLSACHSGDIVRVKDWNDFLAVAAGKEPGTKHAATKDLDLAQQPGFAGTAHALLQGGVPSVVAMRYAVGDDYARALAVAFYRALLAHAQPKNVATALTMARQELLDRTKHDLARFAACDHATPVLYGAEDPGLVLAPGRSPGLEARQRRLPQIAELTTASHEHFVGRTWELAGLGAEFIGSKASAEVKPVAVMTGLGGMGKTALTAEALALWETRFEWVLLYQAKPNALGFDAMLRDMHLKLMGELGRYHNHVKAHPADAISRDTSAEFNGDDRLGRLTRNLIRALKDEPILLVLDNFENNLETQAEQASGAGQPLWACQDPAWDRCLAALANELVDSPSRVLITCRWPIAALADEAAHRVLLGPLPPAEAALYLQEHPGLSRMVFGTDDTEKALALRLLNASRFHPLLMDRLARLAADQRLRPQLMQALDALENTKDFAQLPALFAANPGEAKELAYLDDALATSLDQLIRNTSADARRLLWMIAVANEPVRLELLQGVWSGENRERQQLRKIKELIGDLTDEEQARLGPTPPDLRVKLHALPPRESSIAPLLGCLVNMSLAAKERTGQEDGDLDINCDELVRERIRAWMQQRPQDRAGLTENAIRLQYAERLGAAFEALLSQDMTAALEAGTRALVYCIQAQAWEQLGDLANGVVTSTRNPRVLEGLIPHLETAAESAPEGRSRWICLGNLADALRLGGRPDSSLPFYERAAREARAVADVGGEGSQQARADLLVITGHWAHALTESGHLDASHQISIDNVEASKIAGRLAVDVVGRELEALRIDIIQGKVAMALPRVEARLASLEAWWRQHCSGQSVPEAPDSETLARTFLSALNIAAEAYCEVGDCASALRHLDASLGLKEDLNRSAEDVAATRFNRAAVLGRLSRCAEAQAEMEACLPIFQSRPDWRAKVLGSLAALFDKQGDVTQAIAQQRRALVLQEQLPDASDRAISHGNLANYLDRSDTSPALAESGVAPTHSACNASSTSRRRR